LFYKSLGNLLKNHYRNTEVWFITPDQNISKLIGLSGAKPIKVFNGGIEALFYHYTIY
jgi:putative N6-adenine-specific DNA methylase